MLKRLFVTLAVLLPVSLFASSIEMQKSQWHGCDKYDFKVEGRDAIVVVPQNPAPGNPWIWRPAFFNAFPSVDVALLEAGWHVGYYDVTHLYGSPRAVRLAKSYFDTVVEEFGVQDKAVVEGFSRGGFFSFAWAATYPELVSALYLDAPVCNMLVWPGRNNPGLWKDFLKEWGLEDEEVPDDFWGNAIHHIQTIQAAGLPIFTVCGGKDTVLPFEKNMKLVRTAFQEIGGVVEMIVKPDGDHHPHSLDDPEPIVDFLKRYVPGYSDFQHINLRGDLDNSMYAMTVKKEATVAFLGGSITQMKGWRDQVKEDLQQRFPYTKFHFIEAGIASLGSTPHAFRFEQDVLAQGTPDLMFVEATVNDHTNGFGPEAQVRGMEGIVRHALKANPCMDIVVLDFIYDPFLPMLEDGVEPDVVLNHERVANHYHLNSINMVDEIYGRIAAGELTWKQFGGTHPAWLGHKYYTAAVAKVLDANTRPVDQYVVKPHALPEEPLDIYNYEGGFQVPVTEATKLRGFSVVDDWAPADDAEKRPGFVHVPMLSTDKGGSFAFEFDGRAVGIYCVCGPDAAELKYRIDGGEWKSLDTYTAWSKSLYLPWVYMLADELDGGHHRLQVKVAGKDRTGCHIKSFVVNK